jgi:hypothetical protein
LRRRRGGCSRSPDQINLGVDVLARILLELFKATLSVTHFVVHIAALLVAKIGHAFEERLDQMARSGSRADGQHADPPDFALLLRPRRERPRGRRAAKQRDERAAPCMSGKQHSEG